VRASKRTIVIAEHGVPGDVTRSIRELGHGGVEGTRRSLIQRKLSQVFA